MGSINTNNKMRLVRFGIFLILIISMFSVCAMVEKTFASNKVANTIYDFLRNNDIECASVELKTNNLDVVLRSNGNGRCTIEDTMAISTIFEGIHANSFEEKVNNVHISIYDGTGNMIYDIRRTNMNFDIQPFISDVNNENNITDENIIVAVEGFLQKYTFEVDNIEISSAKELPGRKISISVNRNDSLEDDFLNLESVFDSIQNYAIANQCLSQCEIYLSCDGKCIVFISGDFLYNSFIAWINPSYENSFLSQEGPQ